MESKFHFTYYFPLISANSISFLHCFLSLISIKFFSSESLFRRQIGVLIFEIRSFLDCLEDSLIVKRRLREDSRGLRIEGDFVGLDTFNKTPSQRHLPTYTKCWSSRKLRRVILPSSFPRTRFTAPEHPPQLMLTLNLYVCASAIIKMIVIARTLVSW